MGNPSLRLSEVLSIYRIISKIKFFQSQTITESDCRIPHMTKHMASELITGVNHFQSLIDKPIKLEISLKSSWRSSQLECKTESARIEAYFSLYTPLLPLNGHSNKDQNWFSRPQLSLNAGQKYEQNAPGGILQYFWLSFSYHLSLRYNVCYHTFQRANINGAD